MTVTRPQLYVMYDGQTEFNIRDKLPFAEFMGIDEATPSQANTYNEVPTQDGSRFLSSTIQKNTVNVRIHVHFTTYADLKNKQDALRAFFYRKGLFRLRTSAQPDVVWFVRNVTFPAQPIADGANDIRVTIPMENPSGYRYSRYDSLSQADLWDDYNFNSNFPIATADDFIFKNESNFDIMNPSAVSIDPFTQRHPFSMFLKWTGGSIEVVNETNGTNYSYSAGKDSNNLVELRGCNTFNNGTAANQNTNFGYIKLETGWNHFKVMTSSSHFSVRFKFPFIYV
ncbi:phage tail family protein [Fructilactobacillus cliffordii]|uniref:phage tail domain-containing protein n=1 Tax=Fructilactobacillus cliffordii TaxID=2940299 RepID=UPI002092BECD|nr:phage tail domain-containing protein [Fructilactobacillus cliffordii]USS86500.1 phage tail family protein [Fructilactobacillus cliffordii]